jgi:arsenite-transporting ATPase
VKPLSAADMLAGVFEGVRRPHVVLTMGKGGVGKTTFSVMLGYALASRGYRVLVASLDQAMHLEEYLRLRSRNRVERVEGGLHAVQVDIGDTVRRLGEAYSLLVQQIMPGLKVLNVESVVNMVKHAPGLEEEAYLRELVKLYGSRDYDFIVVDTPPTGLTFRILSLPRLYSFWLDRLIELRERIVSLRYVIARTAGLSYEADDPVLRKLEEQKRVYEGLLESLTRAESTSAAVVATPEPLPVYEAVKSIGFLRESGIAVRIVVANRVLPEDKARMLGVEKVQRESLEKLLSADCRGRCIRLLIPHSEETPNSLDAVKALLGRVTAA